MRALLISSSLVIMLLRPLVLEIVLYLLALIDILLIIFSQKKLRITI